MLPHGISSILSGKRSGPKIGLAKPTEKANFVIFECRGKWTNDLPLVTLVDDDIFLAYISDDKDLTI